MKFIFFLVKILFEFKYLLILKLDVMLKLLDPVIEILIVRIWYAGLALILVHDRRIELHFLACVFVMRFYVLLDGHLIFLIHLSYSVKNILVFQH